jgi:hypothetical protein
MHLLFLFAASLSCPVLNAATARGALGEVQATVVRSEKNPSYSCQFTALDSELSIEVGTLTAPSQFAHFAESACQGGRDVTPLKAIGNDAIACTFVAGRQVVEKVVGRVRNQSFVMRLGAPNDAVNTKSIRIKTTALAEQVAGNLF